MMRVFMFFSLIFNACTLWAVQAASVAAQVDAVVAQVMQQDHIPGLALAVLKDGQPLILKGYGYADIAQQEPVSTSTLFGIGSVSKVITAYALMQLVAQGKVDLDASVLKYIPKAPAQWRNVTIRSLLSHTSGIPQRQGPHLPWLKVWQEVGQKPMQFQPGTQTKYNNFGFIVLGRVIENVTHESLSDYLTQQIFKPFNMNQTGFPAQLLPKGLAIGYHFEKGKMIPVPNRDSWIQRWGSGGIVSSIGDMAKWDRAMSAGQGLKAGAYNQMWTPVFLRNGQASGKNGIAWSLGWQVSNPGNKLIVQKDGAIRGYSSFMIRYIDQHTSIIILTNTNKTHLPRLARQIFMLVK